ncbi:MAG: hypothetical protein R3F41_14230 [Gammaproteobacteria bacterium]|nr:hypothetical protein [Pseudomonadales bacterium]
MGSFFQELRRRSVFKVAAVYAVTSWLIIQIAGEILPTFEAPIWVNQVIILVLALGFPVAIILAWAFELTSEGIAKSTETPDLSGAGPNQGNHSVLIGLMALAVGFLFIDRYLIAPQGSSVPFNSVSFERNHPQVIQSVLNLGEFQRRPGNGNFTFPRLSRDGTLLGYSSYLDGNYTVWIQSLDETDPGLVFERAGNWIGMTNRISSDNRMIAFNDAAGLNVVPKSGGVPRIIGPVNFNSYDWISNDEILFFSGNPNPIQSVSMVNGERQEFPAEEGNGVQSPSWIAGTRYVIYTSVTGNDRARGVIQQVELMNLDTHERHVLLKDAFAPSYLQTSDSAGHILFMRGTELWAVPFDLNNLQFVGREALIVPGIEILSLEGAANYSVSDNGRMVYVPGTDVLQYDLGSALTVVGVSGEQRTLELPLQQYTNPAISPDGERLALTVIERNGDSNVWLYNFQTKRLDRLTFSGSADNALWSSDGSRVYFSDYGRGIYIVNADGTGQPQLLFDTSGKPIPRAIDAESGAIIFQLMANGNPGLFQASSQDSEYVVNQILSDSSNPKHPSLSRDGRWLVYTASESGREEIYLRRFPDLASGGIWQITNTWATHPVWSEDGRELYYYNVGTRKIMRIPVLDDSGLNLGTPSESFQLKSTLTTNMNGNAFVLLNSDSEAIYVSGSDAGMQFEISELVQARLIENFDELVRRTAPVGFD